MSSLAHDEIRVLSYLVSSVQQQVMLIPEERLAALAEQYRRENTLAPCLDPTAWIRTGRVHEEQCAMFEALLRYRRTLGEIKGRLQPPATPEPRLVELPSGWHTEAMAEGRDDE